MVALYVNSRIVCGFFPSWQGAPPQSFERSIWDCVGFYTIHTFLEPSVESQFRIISKSYNFLFGIFIRLLLPSLIVTSSQVRVGMPLPLLSCYLWLGARKPTTQLYNSGMVSRYYLGWPFLHLHRENSASKNLQWETQWPKCCLYETPYIAAPIRETGDIIARTPLYTRLPTDAPTRTRFFWFMSNTFLKKPVSLKYWLLRPFSTRKPHAKAVPSKDYFTHLRTLKNMRKGYWVIGPDYRASHPRCFWAVGDDSRSKIWRPSGLTLRCMPYGRGTLRIPLQRIL